MTPSTAVSSSDSASEASARCAELHPNAIGIKIAANPSREEGTMSAFAYGRLSRDLNRSALDAMRATSPDGEKAAALAERIAALVPADVLLVSGLIMSVSTETKDDGSTVVTNPDLLRWSVPVLVGLGIVLFLIGKLPKWDWGWDFVRALIPAGAYFAWALLSGTNGIVLWERFGSLTGGWELLVAGPLAVILIGLAVRLSPTE